MTQPVRPLPPLQWTTTTCWGSESSQDFIERHTEDSLSREGARWSGQPKSSTWRSKINTTTDNWTPSTIGRTIVETLDSTRDSWINLFPRWVHKKLLKTWSPAFFYFIKQQLHIPSLLSSLALISGHTQPDMTHLVIKSWYIVAPLR